MFTIAIYRRLRRQKRRQKPKQEKETETKKAPKERHVIKEEVIRRTPEYEE